MKKRILAAMLCGAVILSCTGCGPRENTTEQVQSNSALVQTEEKTTTNTSVPDTSNPSESKTAQTDIPTENPNDVTTSSQKTPVSTPKHENPSEKPQDKVSSPPTQPSTPIPPVKQPDSPQEKPYIRPEADEVARKTAEYINKLRKEQGCTTATILPGLTEVAKFRSQQLITNFAHDTEDERKALAKYKYGEFVDMTEYGYDESYSYYTYNGGEAIAKGNWTGTADEIAQKIANGFKNSKGHWAYVGSAEYGYMAVGVTFNPSNLHWYCCVCMSDTNYG